MLTPVVGPQPRQPGPPPRRAVPVVVVLVAALLGAALLGAALLGAARLAPDASLPGRRPPDRTGAGDGSPSANAARPPGPVPAAPATGAREAGPASPPPTGPAPPPAAASTAGSDGGTGGGDARPPRPGPTAVLVAAGDIASCDSPGDEATGALLDQLGGTVATLGDTVYGTGSPAEFAACYDPTWGRQKHRTRPAIGNHDYGTPGAAGFYDYFGSAAGPRGRGWYSYDLGAWHVVALNSNCEVVSCAAGGPQERWLRADLAAHPGACTLAYWHHPRFSSGPHGPTPAVAPLWSALAEAGTDVVLSGHDHDYERFAPLDPAGSPDPVGGIRSFVVGTGGRSHYPILRPLPGSQATNDDTFGVLVLTLGRRGYTWHFVAQAGRTFTDTGSDTCH